MEKIKDEELKKLQELVGTRVRNPVRRIGAHNKVSELVDSNGEKCLTLGRIK